MRKILDLSLVFCLGLGLTSGSVRGDDAEKKAAPPAQVKKAGVTVGVTFSETHDVALTADGKTLARAGYGRLDLWDVASGKKLHRLKGHTAPLLRVKFSPDGKTLASITGGWGPDNVPGEVKLWDVATGKERVALKGHPDRGIALAFSPDGKTLASSAAGPVKLWDVDTGKEKLELKLGKGDMVWSLAFSPDGKTLATGTGGGLMDITPSSVIFWDVTTGKERARTLPAHANSITCVRFASDGKTLASVSGTVSEVKPGTLKLWEVATAKERATIPIRITPPLQFIDLAFTADGKTLTSAMWSIDEKKNEAGLAVDQWELATGKARATFWAPFNAGGNNAGMYFAALSADGKTVAWGDQEKAHVWDVQSLATSSTKLPKRPKEPEKPAEDKKPRMITVPVMVLISAKNPGMSEGVKLKQIEAPTESTGKRDITNPNKGRYQPHLYGTWLVKNSLVRFADTTSHGGTEVLFGIDFGHQAITNLKYVETCQAKSDEGAGTWYVYQADCQIPGPPDGLPVEPKKPTQEPKFTLTGHTKPITSVAFSPDGKTLATGSKDQTVKLWNVAAGKEQATIKPNTEFVESVAFSPDGKTLASGCERWDVATGKLRVAFTGKEHTGFVWCVAFSPDGKTLATGANDQTIKLWDLATGKERATLKDYDTMDVVYSVAFSPNGKTLASGSQDRTIRLWDVATGKEQAKLKGHVNRVNSVAFSPDGKTLASAEDNELKLWDVATAKERATLKHTNWVSFVAYSPDGKTLASSGAEITLWDVASGKKTATLGKGGGPLAYSPDGKTLASGSHVWDVQSLATSPPKLPKEPEKGRTIKRMTMFLIDAKTKGVSEQTETKGPGIKQIEIAEGTVAKKVLPDAKDTNGNKINEYLGFLGRKWVAKSVKMTLADDTVVEVQILLANETGKATLQNVKNGGPRIVSDNGTRTWYVFSAEYHVATDSSKEDIAQAEKDMEGLQGTWRLSKMITVVVKGDRMSHIDSSPGQDFITGIIGIDPKNKEIYWPMETGLGGGVAMLGIYELKGDNLRIIFGDRGRPKTFDEDGWLWVLKREKPTSPPKLPKEPEKPAVDRTKATEQRGRESFPRYASFN